MAGLPDEVRDGERAGDEGTGKEPAVEHQPSTAAEQCADEDSQGEEPDAVLVGQSEPEDEPTEQPPAGVAGPRHPQDHEGEEGPGEEVEGGRTGDVVGTDECRHGGRAESGQQLRTSASTELAGQQAADHDCGAAGQGRPQPQPGERDPPDGERDPGQQRREDRLVDVAALQMASAVEKVQLVAVESVARREEHEDGEEGTTDDPDPTIDPGQRSNRVMRDRAARGIESPEPPASSGTSMVTPPNSTEPVPPLAATGQVWPAGSLLTGCGSGACHTSRSSRMATRRPGSKPRLASSARRSASSGPSLDRSRTRKPRCS